MIKTEGGAYVGGNVITGGGDFVGGDKVAGDKISITEDVSHDVSGLPNPYLGLRAFTYEDRDTYAGRQSEIAGAVGKLTMPGEQRVLLFVTGASGCGKSSFAQAGMMSALEKHYVQRPFTVYKAVFHPGQHPMAAFRDALEQLGIADTVDMARVSALPGSVGILVLDQFEELFTQSIPSERDELLKWLCELRPFQQSRLHVIATIRSDYLEELFTRKPLWDVAKQGIELRTMSVDELEAAIQRPLQARFPNGEKCFEPALVDKLAQDASADSSLLPLLQITLEELWHKGHLVLEKYSVLTDAIKKRADNVYGYIDFNEATPTTRAVTKSERLCWPHSWT